jgi:hypothetical protein
MTLVGELLALIAELVIVSPIIYYGVSIGTPKNKISWENSINVALTGIITAGLVNVLLGGIPVIAVVDALIVRMIVIKYLCPVTWPMAGGIGFVSWIFPLLIFRLFQGI